MSHYTLAIIHEKDQDIHKMLEPFDENTSVEPYVVKEVTEEDKQAFINYYAKEHPQLKNSSFQELYDLFGESWNGNNWKKRNDDVWEEWSTYNPDSKWDWYQVGGRWNGMLTIKDDQFNTAKIKDIDFTKRFGEEQPLTTYAILTSDGRWLAPGEMGWWASSSESEEEGAKWDENYLKIISDNSNPEMLLTIVDCHI